MFDRKFDAIISKIPDYFYPAFVGELFSVFGPDIFTPCEEGINSLLYMPGTGGWNIALKMTCRKLNIDWLRDWYDELDWYDSDNFDCELVEIMNSKFLNSKQQYFDSYYRWLLDNFEVS